MQIVFQLFLPRGINSKYLHYTVNMCIYLLFKNRTCKLRKSGKEQFCAKWLLRMIAQIAVFRAKLMRNERKILRFVPQKFRKSFANGNPNRNPMDDKNSLFKSYQTLS